MLVRCNKLRLGWHFSCYQATLLLPGQAAFWLGNEQVPPATGIAAGTASAASSARTSGTAGTAVKWGMFLGGFQRTSLLCVELVNCTVIQHTTNRRTVLLLLAGALCHG